MMVMASSASEAMALAIEQITPALGAYVRIAAEDAVKDGRTAELAGL